MNTAKDELLKIINEVSESELVKILDFAEYIRDKQDKKARNEFTKLSESSLDFWNNEIDDETWNNV